MVIAQAQYGLAPELLNDLRKIFKHYPDIEKVLLFGSRAKGNFKEGSDIDLAVFGANINSSTFTQIWDQVDRLAIMLKIDILHWDTLQNLALKDKIVAEGVELYVKNGQS